MGELIPLSTDCGKFVPAKNGFSRSYLKDSRFAFLVRKSFPGPLCRVIIILPNKVNQSKYIKSGCFKEKDYQVSEV